MNSYTMPKFKVNLEKQLNKYFSCDLDVFFQLKMYFYCPKLLSAHTQSPRRRKRGLFVVLYRFCGQKWRFRNSHSDSHQTSTKSRPDVFFGISSCSFNEPIKYPVKIKDLNLDSNVSLLFIFRSFSLFFIFSHLLRSGKYASAPTKFLTKTGSFW